MRWIVGLERVAGREGKSVDAVLAKELLDLASVHAPWLSSEASGFAEALQWAGVNGGALSARSAKFYCAKQQF